MYVYGVIIERCVVVGLVMFCVCGVHGSDKLCLKLTVCLRKFKIFVGYSSGWMTENVNYFSPRVMSVDTFFIQLACLTLNFMLHLIQCNTRVLISP